MLENVPGGYVIDGTEALRATPDAGYRSHRHELPPPTQAHGIADVDDAEFLWA